VFNTTFSNISAISWRPVLVVEEARVPGENHRPLASNWETLLLAAASRVHPFCDLQSRARTHAVLMIGLYEWLGIASFLWSKINDDLADVVNGFIREGINDEKYSEIMKYIARPENCTY
jgi:hypothetical protein